MGREDVTGYGIVDHSVDRKDDGQTQDQPPTPREDQKDYPQPQIVPREEKEPQKRTPPPTGVEIPPLPGRQKDNTVYEN